MTHPQKKNDTFWLKKKMAMKQRLASTLRGVSDSRTTRDRLFANDAEESAARGTTPEDTIKAVVVIANCVNAKDAQRIANQESTPCGQKSPTIVEADVDVSS